MQNRNNKTDSNADYPESINDDFWKQAISPVVFNKPAVLPESAWTEHIPFAFWLINALKPTVFVELGTHYGLSYFSFCQAIQNGHLQTKCYAIDNWKGDEHAGYYDESIFEFVNTTNESYNSFSTLYRSTFDDAVSSFENKSIDLLHIDGFHTYEAVKHDFFNWLPKISESGIVIFHDTNVLDRGFGVYKLWEELIQQYPYFEFKHGFGLGILGVGQRIPKKVETLFKLRTNAVTHSTIQEIYERLGSLLRIESEYNKTNAKLNLEKEEGERSEKQSTQVNAKADSSTGSDRINNIQPEAHLHILESIFTQVFWKKEDEEFNESNSVIQTIQLTNTKSLNLFKLSESFSSLKKIRIDPAAKQGIFYLHSISIADDTGKLVLNWDTIKAASSFFNLIIFKSSLIENAFVLISTTDDPIIEIELSSKNQPENTDHINLIIAVSKLENDSLHKELSNITVNELKTEKIDNSIQIFNSILENLHSTKEDINNAISFQANDILMHLKKESLIQQQKLNEDKNDFLTELKEQRLLLSKYIADANLTIQKNENTICDLSKKLEEIKLIETNLRGEFLKKSFEFKTLTLAYENSQKELNNLEVTMNKDAIIIQNQMNEIITELNSKKSMIEMNQKELLLNEQKIQAMQNEISNYKLKYDNNSILGIIKNKILNAQTK